ncbi:MAG TPA: hypothetical protein VFF03_09445 [Rhodocyclaceae bacterium]|nr:hypothetical protein [Rhodocyclaceae bacterium]
MFARRYIVQDRESCLFLGFEDGDIAPVRLVKHAVKFETEEAAILTALGICDAGYVLFSFYVDTEE